MEEGDSDTNNESILWKLKTVNSQPRNRDHSPQERAWMSKNFTLEGKQCCWHLNETQIIPLFFFYNTFKKYLFIYLAASALSCSTHLCCVMWDLSLWHVDSVVAASGLSCSVAYGILVPWPGMEPVSLALEGGFLTTGPQGKPQVGLLTCRTVRQWACVVLRHEQMTNGDLQRKYCFA